MHLPFSKGLTSLVLSHGWDQVQAHSLHVLDLLPHIPGIEKVKNKVKELNTFKFLQNKNRYIIQNHLKSLIK